MVTNNLEKEMNLTKELFVLEDGKNFILYAPLINALAKVNPVCVQTLKKIEKQEKINSVEESAIKNLKDLGFIVNKNEISFVFQNEATYHPTDLVIIPGTDCNLKCKYCYAHSGEVPKKSLDLKIAKSAIDLIIKNAEKKGVEDVLLTFTGGGEPFYGKSWDVVKKCTEHINKRAKKLNPYICAATNGVLSQPQLEWITQNLSSIQISLDGPEDIQNFHRPMKDGGPSYDQVLRTIKYFEKNKFRYIVRSTITEHNVSRLEEMIDFFKGNSPSADGVYFEPVTECGRCTTTSIHEPDMKEFAENLIKEKVKEDGINIGFSISKAKFSKWNCGAAGKYFVLTPEGKVSTCARGLEEFYIGQYDVDKGGFLFDQEKITNLDKRNIDNLPYCSDCFAKYNCSGGCLSRSHIKNGDMFNPEDERCYVHREYLKCELKILLNENKIKYQEVKNDKTK